MAIFDFVQENPVAGVGFVYKSSSNAYYYNGTSVTPIGVNSVFSATTGTGTTTMTIGSVSSGTVAAGQLIGKGATVTFTAPSTVNWTSNGLSVGDQIQFITTGTLPTGLELQTNYFVKTAATNSITISKTNGGPALTFSGTGTGTTTGIHLVSQIISFNTFNGTSGTVTLSVAVTWTNPTTFYAITNYPATTVRGIVYLDGTYYVMTPQGSIYGSGINDPTYWSSLNVIQSNAEPDGGIALFRQLNLLVAFGAYSSEFFYDAANPTGSPLLPYSSAFIEVGCAHAYTIAQSDNSTYFMGVTKQKGRGLYRLNGTNPEYLSNPFIDRIFNADDLANVNSFCVRIGGHIFYILYLGTTGITLVYDVSMGYWATWTVSSLSVSSNIDSISWNNNLVTVVNTSHTYSDGDLVVISGNTPSGYNGVYTINVLDDITFTYDLNSNPGVNTVLGTSANYIQSPFSVASYTSGNNLDIIQDSTTGFIYLLDNGTYTDNGNPIEVLARTFKFDAGDNKKKFTSQLEIIGDKVSSTAYISYSNDDYQTWSKYRPVNLDQQRSLLNRLGQTRRRAYRLRHHDNVPLRLESLEQTVIEGSG